MNKKEQLNTAFSKINDVLIDSAQAAPAPKNARYVKWIAAISAAAILFCFGVGSFLVISKLKQNASNEYVSKYGWTLVSCENNLVKKEKTALNGLQFNLTIRYDNLIAYPEGFFDTPLEEDSCAEMLGQWITSLISSDYSQHFPLFSEAFLNDTVYPEFERIGFDTDTAYQKISQVAAEVMGFTKYSVDLSIQKIDKTSEALAIFQSEWSGSFNNVGLDAKQVEDYCLYTLGDTKIIFNDIFYLNANDFLDFDSFAFYKYNGVWYASPEILDDDLSIDMLQSDKNENGDKQGYYREQYTNGTVSRIENEYLVLDDTNYFLIRSDITNVKEGDNIEVSYYGIGLVLNRIADHTQCEINVLSSVSVVEPSKMLQKASQ